MEMGRIAGQDNYTAGRIGLHFISVELITQANIENAGHDCVDGGFRVPMRHQLHAGGHLDPDQIRAGLGRMSGDDGEADRWRERRERLPVDIFRQDRPENGLTGLMVTDHSGSFRRDGPPDLAAMSMWRPIELSVRSPDFVSHNTNTTKPMTPLLDHSVGDTLASIDDLTDRHLGIMDIHGLIGASSYG